MRKRLKSSETNWQTLVGFFPAHGEALARETGAHVRLRGFPSVAALMQPLLLPSARGYSLRETVGRAKLAGLGPVSAVALLKRLRNAAGWFHRRCEALLREQALIRPARDKQRALRLVESTLVKEPGKTGSLWRLP